MQALTFDGRYYWANVFVPGQGARLVRYELVHAPHWKGSVRYDGNLIPVGYYTVKQDVNYKSIASDAANQQLYLASKDGKRIYRYDIPKAGRLDGKTIQLPDDGFINVSGGNITGSLCIIPGLSAAPPRGFWCRFNNDTTRELVKLSMKGKPLGSIYPPAEKVWALTHDGTYLYAVARTHEGFQDKKIFIIDTFLDGAHRLPFLGTDPGILRRRALTKPLLHGDDAPVQPAVRESGLERFELLTSAMAPQEDFDQDGLMFFDELIEEVDREHLLRPAEIPDASTSWEILSHVEYDEPDDRELLNTGADIGMPLDSSWPIVTDHDLEYGGAAEAIPAHQDDPDNLTPDAVNELAASSITVVECSGCVTETLRS